jgi:hypothetical protein
MSGDSPPGFYSSYTEDELVSLLAEAVQEVQSGVEGQSLALPTSVSFILSSPAPSESSGSDSGFNPSTRGSENSRSQRRFRPLPPTPATFTTVETPVQRGGSRRPSSTSPSGSCSDPGEARDTEPRRAVEDTPSLSYLSLEPTLVKERNPSGVKLDNETGM